MNREHVFYRMSVSKNFPNEMRDELWARAANIGSPAERAQSTDRRSQASQTGDQDTRHRQPLSQGGRPHSQQLWENGSSGWGTVVQVLLWKIAHATRAKAEWQGSQARGEAAKGHIQVLGAWF